ncbi:glycosyltransferase family 4 protein [Flavobacteriaceae bacterium TP-CH-4]|uniref:Glycosyltransferase family 4 protein n=1 Tax=Pelagihabitans pacificus TaxID=2696054 RepID=A0A967AYP5_9FLAO|nr:glycosyltransferase family 4 protein [Pelagihabitans pacificus]NHF61540.1 glycosyltransferase family 4 protein [Pelagihabitans pacificus]
MKNNKTIAFVINSLSSGGAERVVSILANSLVRTYNVIIITFIDAPIFYDLDKEIKIRNCTAKIEPSKNPFQAISSNLLLIRKIGYFLKKDRVDVCIGFMTTANILAVIASKTRNIPVLISERNNPYLEDNSIPRYWKIFRRFAYPKANFLIVQTDGIKEFYKKFIRQNRLKIIPNPINPSFKKTDGIGRENIILNVGRLSDQKAQDILIRAFANIRPKDWKLHIVGEGEKKEILESLIDDLNMSGQIELLGTSENIEELYGNSKIFAFTSIFEGFPNALLEAMHFGLACISTDCPTGPRELITDGENGYLIPVNDIKALENKLIFLMNNEQEIKRIGNAASIYTQKYQADRIVSKWEDLLTLAK